MVDPKKKRYLYMMLAGFGAISLSIVLFFLLDRMETVEQTLNKVGDILAPFAYGGVMAYLLRPACNLYEDLLKKAFPKKLHGLAVALAVGMSLLTGVLVVYALIIMIAPQLYESILSLWNSLPDKIDQFLNWAIATFGENEALLSFFDTSFDAAYAELEAWAQNTLLPYVTNIVSVAGSGVMKVLSFIYNVLIGLFVAAYLLGSRKKFARQGILLVRSTLKPKWADIFLEEVAFVDKMFGGFIDGKIVDSAIMGVLCYIGCLIFRFPNALLISAFVGVTNVIPFFGPFIGAIPSALLILIEDPMKAVWFSLFILALQQLDGNVIGPAILGDRTGVSSFWVLFSIILFGGLWGVAGMVVAVPLFAVIYDLLKKYVRRGLARKEQIEIWEQYKADYPDEKDK